MGWTGDKCIGCQDFEYCSENRADPKLSCSEFKPSATAHCGGNCLFYSSGKTCKKGYKTFPEQSYCNGYAYAVYEEEKTNKPKGGCFLSTAICLSQGLPDNCTELQTLRIFRDNELLPDPKFSHLVDIYYQESPQMVDKLSSNIEACQFLYENYITDLIDMINAKQDKSDIVSKYQDMFYFVKNM